MSERTRCKPGPFFLEAPQFDLKFCLNYDLEAKMMFFLIDNIAITINLWYIVQH